LKEKKTKNYVSAPKKSSGRPAIKLDEDSKYAIRRIVHSFFFKNEPPTLDKVLTAIHADGDLPKLTRSVLWKSLKELNFCFKKRNRKSILIDREDIILWRRNYLRSIKQYRQEGKKNYYLDESWLNEGHTPTKVWHDNAIKSRRQAFMEGFSTGLKQPSGKGKRLIITHVGSDSGFVPDGLLLFESKTSKDYHEEMNAIVFEDWFQKILTLIEPNSVVVMDNASYHSRREERLPTTSWRKANIQNWLSEKGISYDDGMVKTELMCLVKLHKQNYLKYAVDEMAKAAVVTVLSLPPYHCELNRTELIWAYVKGRVARENTTFKLADVKILFQNAISNTTPELWRKCIQHTIVEEEKMWQLDVCIEATVEPLIIHVGESDDYSDLPEEFEDES
jgi:transposase